MEWEKSRRKGHCGEHGQARMRTRYDKIKRKCYKNQAEKLSKKKTKHQKKNVAGISYSRKLKFIPRTPQMCKNSRKIPTIPIESVANDHFLRAYIIFISYAEAQESWKIYKFLWWSHSIATRHNY